MTRREKIGTALIYLPALAVLLIGSTTGDWWSIALPVIAFWATLPYLSKIVDF